MGSTFSNVQVYAGDSDPQLVREQLLGLVRRHLLEMGFKELTGKEGAAADRTIVIGYSGESPWVSLLDEAMEEEPETADGFCALASAELQRPLLNIAVFDSDVAMLRLFAKGAVVDQLTSDRPRKRLKHWEPLLRSPYAVDAFREAFYQRRVFAEQALGELAPMLGLPQPLAEVGYEYLQQTGLPEDCLVLRFRRQGSPLPRPQKTRLHLTAYLGEWEGRVGELKIAGCGAANRGEGSIGVQILIWGPAVAEGIVEVSSVHLYEEGYRGQMVPVATPLSNGETGLVATFSDYPIRNGFDPEDPAYAHLNWFKKFKRQQESSFGFSLNLTGLQAGRSKLHVALLPLVNPVEGQASFTVSVGLQG